MREDGQNASDALHSSKRLRLSILRSQRPGPSRDSAAASTSSTVNLPSISYGAAQVGIHPTNEPESTSLSDHSLRRSPENTFLLETNDGSASVIEGNVSSITDIRELHIFHEAGNGLLDFPCEVPDDAADQQRELQGRQLEDGAIHRVESIPAEPGAEMSAGSGDPIGPPQGHNDPLSPVEEETDNAMQDCEVSGEGPSNHLDQEVDRTRSQELELEVRPLISQQQDGRSSHNVTTFDQPGTPVLRHTLDTSLEAVEANETESSILHAEARNPVVVAVELSEDDGEAESVDPTLTASAFSEPRLTPEDNDAFAPEPHLALQPIPEAKAGTSNPEQPCTQLDSEGTTCPICMEPWTSTGNHRICSLACGHLFGKACIKRWLKLAGRKQGKCPHCNKRARVEDLRTLYVPRIAVIDGESQHYMEEAGALRTENEFLKKQVVDLREEIRRSQALFRVLDGDRREAFTMFGSSGTRPQDQRGHYALENRRHSTAHTGSRPASHRAHGSANHDHSNLQRWSIRERPHIDHLVSMRSTDLSASRPIPEENWRRLFGISSSGTGSPAGMIEELQQQRERNIAARPLRSFTSFTVTDSQDVENRFILKDGRSLNGAKVFDMDAQSQLLLVSGRPPDSMTSSGLTKMSLLALSEGECINLPFGTGAIRDIRIAPTGTRAPGRLALVASLGKKLSLFSLESNNVVITYTLPNPSWACAWDPYDPNRVYTGLQNGTLLTFDMRQTSSPLETRKGPSSTPIHTLQYVPKNARAIAHEGGTSEGGGLLSASSSTLLFWPGIDQPQENRPVCLSQPGGSSVCVSISYNAAVDVMVASFRPKPTTVPSNDSASSSTLPTHSQTDVPSQSTPSVLPETTSTASVSVPIPTHFRYVRTTCAVAEDSGMLHSSWEQQGAMVGHKSQAVLSRTAIVNEWTEAGTGSGQGNCLFASGDEGSNSVWLWDSATPTVKQTLTSHPYSPVLDIRTAHVAGVDLLGCISERTLQLYRRVISG